jgi:hypothetical protein
MLLKATVKIIVYIVFAIIIGVLTLLVGHGSAIHEKGRARIIGYSARIRATAILGLLIGTGFCVWSVALPPQDSVEIGGAGVFFATASLWMIVEVFKTKIILMQEGIGKISWWSKPKFLPWNEVDVIHLGRLTDWVVRGKGGQKIVVPNNSVLDSFEWFKEACRDHLSSEQYPEVFRK